MTAVIGSHFGAVHCGDSVHSNVVVEYWDKCGSSSHRGVGISRSRRGRIRAGSSCPGNRLRVQRCSPGRCSSDSSVRNVDIGVTSPIGKAHWIDRDRSEKNIDCGSIPGDSKLKGAGSRRRLPGSASFTPWMCCICPCRVAIARDAIVLRFEVCPLSR